MNPSSLMAEVLDEIAAYRGQTVVVKIGGNALADNPAFLPLLAEQMAVLQKLGLRLVLAHGAGPQIDAALQKAGFARTRGPDGRRPTHPSMMPVIEQAVRGVQTDIARALGACGCRVFEGVNAPRAFVAAKPLREDRAEEDRTGFPESVDKAALEALLKAGNLILAPSWGVDAKGQLWNINADDIAMALAGALSARRLVMMTNVEGVWDADKKVVSHLTRAEANALIASAVIAGGMIPKIEGAFTALDRGVAGVAIVGCFVRGALMAELLTHVGSGTLIVP